MRRRRRRRQRIRARRRRPREADRDRGAGTGARAAAQDDAGDYTNKPTGTPSADTAAKPAPVPMPKPVVEVSATKVFNTLASGIYLERQEDVDNFVNALKDELQTAIAAGKRVRLK